MGFSQDLTVVSVRIPRLSSFKISSQDYTDFYIVALFECVTLMGFLHVKHLCRGQRFVGGKSETEVRVTDDLILYLCAGPAQECTGSGGVWRARGGQDKDEC